MKRSQIVAIAILIAAGSILAAAYLGMLDWPVEYVNIGIVVLIVGLGVGQALNLNLTIL